MQKIKYSSTIRNIIVIGLCFLWTSSGYLSWLYNLMRYTSLYNADILSEVVGYIFQALGIGVYSVLLRKNHEKFAGNKAFIITMVTDFVFIAAAIFAQGLPAVLIFGYCMNFMHGVVATHYLIRLANEVDWNKRGITFGIGYGIASICSYLISKIDNNNFLKNDNIIYVYFVLVLITIVTVLLSKGQIKCIMSSQTGITPDNIRNKGIFLCGATILMLSLVKSMGFFFPSADISSGVNLELSRAFYAIGLIVAGIICDKNRKYGAISCIVSLVFPFAMIALAGSVNVSILLWIIAYVFTGFFVVYRTVLFCDIANDMKYIYISAFGLCFGRIGDAIGYYGGIMAGDNTIILVAVSSVCYAITLLLFFKSYNKIYFEQMENELSEDEKIAAIIKDYNISGRESEVMHLILQGMTNIQISEKMYISENTVKFHIRNILKKTNTKNKVELTSLVKEVGK